MDDLAYPRFASRGRAFVYVLPCADDTLLKIGFSRTPMQRLRSLHARFFDFFDLDAGVLIETDFVRDARAIERRYIAKFSAYQALAPLAVSEAAGGFTEWYRGIGDEARAFAAETAATQGFRLHALGDWLREALGDNAVSLYGWSAWIAEAIEYETHNVPAALQTRRPARALRDTLDLYAKLGMEITDRIAPAALAWYRGDAMAR